MNAGDDARDDVGVGARQDAVAEVEDVARGGVPLGDDPVDGRGEQVGQTITDLNAYLEEINPQIETLQRDLAKGSRVANLYADVTPELMRLLDSGTDVGTDTRTERKRLVAPLKREDTPVTSRPDAKVAAR